jgi:hypothetical protein
MSETDTGGMEYSDPDEPTCKYCGGTVKRIVPEGTPYWNCAQHGRLNVSEVLGVTAGSIPSPTGAATGGER